MSKATISGGNNNKTMKVGTSRIGFTGLLVFE